MSNFNAFLNAIVVATNSNHAVQATTAAASAPGANAAAVLGHAAAASGAAAHGAANVAGTNVSATTGAGNSAQPAAPPGLLIPRGVPLRCTDSTTDLVEKKDNGQFYSLRLGGTVNSPFTQHFPPPSPFAGPSRGYRAGQPASLRGSLARKSAALRRTGSTTKRAEKNGNGQPDSARKPGIINDAVIQQFPPPPPFDQPATFPSLSVASTRPPPPVVLPDILPLQPIVIPIDLFAPAPVTQFMVETGPSTALPPSSRPAIAVVPVYPGAEGLDRPYYDAINVRAAKSRSDLAWPGAGLRERQPHAHHTTPEDCQALRRWMLYRGRKDSNLILAEALCVENKNQQLIMLLQLREADLLDPPHLRENFVTGAQVAAQCQIARAHAWLQLAAAQAAFVASQFFPEVPPVPAPQPSLPPLPRPPRSIWSTVAGAMAGMLKRKRGADDESEEHPTKRARVQKEPEPQQRFVFLRRVGTEQPPPTLGGAIVETCPELLPEHGAAAFPETLHTSNVAMQTCRHVFPALAPSLVHAGVAGPSLQSSTAPLARTPPLTGTGVIPSPSTLAGSPAGEQRCVRFTGCPESESIAPPRRYSSPPPPPRDWTQDEDEDEDEDMLTDAMLTPADLAALGLDFNTAAEPTDRHAAAGDDAAYNDSPMQDDSLPSPDAATGQKRRCGMRTGRQVQRRRASKEAATVTERKVDGA